MGNWFHRRTRRIERAVLGNLRLPIFLCIRPISQGCQGDEVRSAEEKKKEPLERTGGGMDARKDRNIGDALRRVYSDAVDESIPDDLLNLLSKLD